ncbi:MAG: TIGR02710 family CRISPR-associated CARF protein [Methanobrevibacter ruminantium]|uniref:TIGR02710 family CRISPR-associated CARF protein n=1 Tax=Methanobrevibacter ruminantium TaxID=83816 RepID=UPI002D7EDB05|nr:TIGR02710 family CRISPR-associated CARF protein [Methanobrevibacter ruminantium]MCI5738110.1 TIGR02710 family CRISPR-associated CARF protein [Methanobrevibacter ruminantium]
MTKTALILTIGLATEPSIKRINSLEPDLVYFIHSNKSKENALFIIEETGISNYEFKELEDHESVDDAFVKSLECIHELKENGYEVIGDFTVGTKPMVAGLVMACVEEKCDYKYLGESSDDARESGMGPVRSGFEKTKDQENPYENYAINEFKSGKEFFDKYQFLAARENFKQAEEKLKYCELKKRSKIFIKIVDFYEHWDKFNDEIIVKNNQNQLESIKLNKFLESEILESIENDEDLLKYFEEEIPNFYNQLKKNKLFLDKKIAPTNDIYKNISYYLPDLLNNAERRIEEGKYDDAVARLYRALELVGQLRLYKYKFIDKEELNNSKSFYVKKEEVIKKSNSAELAEIKNKNLGKWRYKDKLLNLDLGSSYRLLNIISKSRTDDFSESTQDLVKSYYRVHGNFQKRNTSILAHGLRPLNERDAKKVYDLMIKHSSLLSEHIDNNRDFARFPLFANEDE